MNKRKVLFFTLLLSLFTACDEMKEIKEELSEKEVDRCESGEFYICIMQNTIGVRICKEDGKHLGPCLIINESDINALNLSKGKGKEELYNLEGNLKRAL